jgi:hypothetical protein
MMLRILITIRNTPANYQEGKPYLSKKAMLKPTLEEPFIMLCSKDKLLAPRLASK